jgi:hypothetical protein
MGGAGKEADQEGAAQWLRNPAGLAHMGMVPGTDEASRHWMNLAMFGYDDCDRSYGVDWSGWDPETHWGLGAGYERNDNGDSSYGIGAGTRIGSGFSVGLNAIHSEQSYGSSSMVGSVTRINLGLQYKYDDFRFGLAARDLTDQTDDRGVYDFGVSWRPNKHWTIDADLRDFTDKYQVTHNIGGEFRFGDYNEWAIRAGLHDNGESVGWVGGAGYTFRSGWVLDALYEDEDDCWKADICYPF